MAKFIVAVDKLNIRSFVPTSLSDKAGIVGEAFKGYTFEGAEETNVPTTSLGKWYRDLNGYFFWGGGVNALSAETPAPVDNDAWYYKLRIPELQKATIFHPQNSSPGKNVTVAILDSGIATEHKEQFFKDSFDEKNSRSFTNTSIEDTFGHGTHCAGLIAASLNDQFLSIAPTIRLLMGKISNAGTPSVVNLQKALEWVKDNKDIDILSISGGIFGDYPQIKKLIDEISAQDTIIISSIGNAPGHGAGLYPAKYFKQVVSVGSTDSLGTISGFTIRSPELTICVPGENIKSLFPSTTEVLSGTSQACAVMTGISALVVSKLKKDKKIKPEEFKQFIYTNSVLRSHGAFSYRILQLDSFISQNQSYV